MTREEYNPSMCEPFFSAQRLTIARQCRALTKRTLAEKIGVKPQTITSYEDGTIAPTDDRCAIIARELNFDIAFFYADDVEQIPLEAISFRSRRSLTARVRDKTKACGEIAADIVSPALSNSFRLPKTDIPEYLNEKPEAAACFIRAYWELGQGPITNMVHLLEAKGVELYWFEEESPYVDAVSLWRDNKPFVIASMRYRGGERLRFDLAHELGHLVLHRDKDNIDSYEIECEANRFASAFLLPEPQFRLEFPLYPTLAQFLELKTRWKVSVQAMIHRGRDMGLLSSWQYQSLFKQLSAKWGRMREPCQLAFEESAIQPQIFERFAAKGIYAEDFARSIRLKIDDLITLIPAAKNFREQVNAYGSLTIEELGYNPPNN